MHGQTDRLARGMGAFASRVTVMCGEATRMAAVKLRDAALKAAAELMQTAADKLDIVDGQIASRDGGASMPLSALAGLTAEDTFESTHMVYPYGVHVAMVRVDADTGGVAIENYAIAYDVGRAVHPRLVEGQLAGGLAQGIGGALYEEFLYDEAGEPLSVTFADYLMPTAHEVPNPALLVTEDAPSPLYTLGLKGAGEGGANRVGDRRRVAMARRDHATPRHAAAAEGADPALITAGNAAGSRCRSSRRGRRTATRHDRGTPAHRSRHNGRAPCGATPPPGRRRSSW